MCKLYITAITIKVYECKYDTLKILLYRKFKLCRVSVTIERHLPANRNHANTIKGIKKV